MNEVKYQITQFIFLVLLGLAAYWALTNLDNGITYTRDQMITDEEITNALNNNQQIENEVLSPDTSPVVEQTITEVVDEVVVNDVVPVPQTESNNSSLITELQKMADDKVFLDSGANGENVATVQEFLDIYFADTDISVDRDFGPTTKRLVRDFQRKELGGGDGRIGPNTLGAMVEYLRAQ